MKGLMKVFSFQWLVHVESMENDRIVYVGGCAGSHLVGRSQKRCIDTMKNYLKKNLDVRQAKIMQGIVFG